MLSVSRNQGLSQGCRVVPWVAYVLQTPVDSVGTAQAATSCGMGQPWFSDQQAGLFSLHEDSKDTLEMESCGKGS